MEVLPDDKTIWIQRGLVYADLQEYHLAIDDFTEAIDIDPNCASAMFHMATSRLKCGQVPQAIIDFQTSAAVQPQPAIQDGLGQCHHKLHEFDKAILAFNSAISAENRNIEFLKHRSQCYYDMAKYQLCIDDLSLALEINPFNQVALYKQGLAYYTFDKYKKAIATFKSALRNN